MSITTKIERITPKIAARMLKPTLNVHQRDLSQVNVDIFANAMLRNKWEFNGAPIIIGTGGKLMDGQHRLRAVIQSGIARDFVVVRGVAPNTFGTIDTGARRGLKDVLSIGNEKNAPVLATAINTHRAYTRGRSFATKMRRHSATYPELVKYLEKNPSLRGSVKFVDGFATKFVNVIKLSRGSLAALHALCAIKDRAFADEFFTKLVSGDDFSRGKSDQPVKAARLKLIADATQRAASLSQSQKCVVVTLAWNAARANDTIGRFQVSARGGKNKAREIEIQ
jgi:hypothetical protein